MRSPNYPAIGLPDAIESIDALWAKEKKTPVDVATIAAAWGYSSVSGRVRSKLGALRKYGLVEDTADGTRVSELAMRILHGIFGTDDHTAALRESALKPSLFRELYSTHSGASDQAIKSYLMLKKDFSDAGAREVIKAFRETIEVAKLVDGEYTPHGTTSDETEDDMGADASAERSDSRGSTTTIPLISTMGARTNAVAGGGAAKFVRPAENPVGDSIPVSQDCKMSVWASGEVTQAGIEKLISYLQLIKDSYPKPEPNHMA